MVLHSEMITNIRYIRYKQFGRAKKILKWCSPGRRRTTTTRTRKRRNQNSWIQKVTTEVRDNGIYIME